MIENLFDVIQSTQGIKIIKQRAWPTKGQINSISFTFILRLGDPLCDVFKVLCLLAVSRIDFVAGKKTSREDRVRSIGQSMRRHRAITSIYFHSIRHPSPMDLQIAIIRRRARLPTCDLGIRIFHELIEFLY
jgi:hypothetical protein